MRKHSSGPSTLRATRLRSLLPLILTLAGAAACGDSEKTPEAEENDRGSESNSSNNGQNDTRGSGDDGSSDDGFGDDGFGDDGSGDDGSGDDGSGDDGSGNGGACPVLPRQLTRYSGVLETATDQLCGVFALEIAPDGLGNSYALAYAQQDASNPSRTTNVTVVLQGPLTPNECTNAPLLRRASSGGTGVGPTPFLDTKVTAVLNEANGSAPLLNVSLQTNGASNAIDCEGFMTKEP